MGVFEFSNFSEGTKAVGYAVVEATKNGAVSIIGQFCWCCVCVFPSNTRLLHAQVEVTLQLLLPSLAWRTRSAIAVLE